MENSEWLGRQARPGFEPGTSRLPVLSVTAVSLVGRTSIEECDPIGMGNYYSIPQEKFSVLIFE